MMYDESWILFEPSSIQRILGCFGVNHKCTRWTQEIVECVWPKRVAHFVVRLKQILSECVCRDKTSNFHRDILSGSDSLYGISIPD